jgi:hypothetical protein
VADFYDDYYDAPTGFFDDFYESVAGSAVRITITFLPETNDYTESALSVSETTSAEFSVTHTEIS